MKNIQDQNNNIFTNKHILLEGDSVHNSQNLESGHKMKGWI